MIYEYFILVNAATNKGYSSLKLDRSRNLINTVRVMVKNKCKELGYFFTPEDVRRFQMESDFPSFTARCLNGDAPIKLDIAVPLENQLPPLGEHEEIIIELDTGYYPKKLGNLPVPRDLDVLLSDITTVSVVDEDKQPPSEEVLSGQSAQQESDSEAGKNSTSQKPKKKRKWFLIPILLLLLLITVEACLILRPDVLVKGQLALGKQDKAIEAYNERIAGHENHEAETNPVFEKLIDGIKEDYQNGKVTVAEAEERLGALQELDSSYLKGRISAALEWIYDYESAMATFNQAEEYLGAGRYEDAFVTYSQLKDNQYFVQRIQAQIADCAEKLLADFGPTDTAEACVDAISKLDYYSSINDLPEIAAKREEISQILAGINTSELRQGILNRAEESFQTGDFATAFSVLAEGLEQIPGDKNISDTLDSYHASYIIDTMAAAEAALAQQDYASAKDLLTNAVQLYDDGTLQKKLEEVNATVAELLAVYTAPEAKVSQCKGTITDGYTRKTYNFTPETSGRYILTTADMVYGMWIRVYVVKAANNETVSEMYMYNGTFQDVNDLVANQKYSIIVEAGDGTGDYTIDITHQKATADVSLNEIVKDSMQAGRQLNEYTFTPSLSGFYTFEFVEMLHNTCYAVKILDPLNNPLADQYIYCNQYINCYMQAGTCYRIQVTQSDLLGGYTMKIGKQTQTETISTNEVKRANLTFHQERKVYTFTPQMSGTYNFITSSMKNNSEVEVDIRDELENPYLETRYYGDDSREFTVEAGKTYTIQVIATGEPIGLNLQITRGGQ